MRKPLLFSRSATNRVSFALNASRLVSAIFITPRAISATHSMKSRLAIKFLTTMSSDQMPGPREDLVHQIPSLPGKRRRKMPGVCPGGMFKLRFDWYIRRHYQPLFKKGACAPKSSLLGPQIICYSEFAERNKFRNIPSLTTRSFRVDLLRTVSRSV